MFDLLIQWVSGMLVLVFGEVCYEIFMFSFGNVFEEQDLLDFDCCVCEGLVDLLFGGDLFGGGVEVEYSCELKLDGLVVSLFYECG